MKITFNNAKELSGFLLAPASLAKKSSQKFSEFIALKFTDQEFVFSGSNGVNSLEQRFLPNSGVAVVEESGAISVASQKLCSYLKTFGSNKVTIETISRGEGKDTLTQLVVKSGRTRLLCDTIDYELAPQPIKSMVKTEFKHVQLDFNSVQTAIHHIKHAMPTNSAKAMLNGIHFKAEGDILRLWATDGFRLASYSIKLSQAVSEVLAFTVPCHSVGQLQTLNVLNASVYVNHSAIRITDGITSYQSALIDHKYPDIERAVPKSGVGLFVLNKAELSLLLDRAQIALSSEAVPRIEMTVQMNGLVACYAGQGKALYEDEIQAKHVQLPSEVRLILNYKYLKDAISTILTDDVVVNLSEMTLNGGTAYNSILTPASEQAKSFFTLIMPMR